MSSIGQIRCLTLQRWCGLGRVSFQPTSCSANHAANAAIRSSDVSLPLYFVTASSARCLRSASGIGTDYQSGIPSGCYANLMIEDVLAVHQQVSLLAASDACAQPERRKKPNPIPFTRLNGKLQFKQADIMMWIQRKGTSTSYKAHIDPTLTRFARRSSLAHFILLQA